jgi:hypothetical protein
MTPVYIHNAASWEEADEHFEAFAAVVSERRRELAERVAASGGPVLDRSLGSLGPLNEWFIAEVLDRPAPAEVNYRPAWLPAPNPDYRPNPTVPRATPGWLFLFWEQISVYVGDVMAAQVPGAGWVCWRSPYRGRAENGEPVIDVGNPETPFAAITCARAGVLLSWAHQGTGDDSDVRPDPSKMQRFFQASLDSRAAYLAEHPARWQSAPTGPRARRSQPTPPVRD